LAVDLAIVGNGGASEGVVDSMNTVGEVLGKVVVGGAVVGEVLGTVLVGEVLGKVFVGEVLGGVVVGVVLGGFHGVLLTGHVSHRTGGTVLDGVSSNRRAGAITSSPPLTRTEAMGGG
jgi:hypothetical protein